MEIISRLDAYSALCDYAGDYVDDYDMDAVMREVYVDVDDWSCYVTERPGVDWGEAFARHDVSDR